MTKTVMIGEQEVKFRTSAALPRIYRLNFSRDIFVDMNFLLSKSKEGVNYEDLIEVSTMVENIAYCMAKHADDTIPDTIDEWLGQFDTLDIYGILPEIITLWADEQRTTSTPKK